MNKKIAIGVALVFACAFLAANLTGRVDFAAANWTPTATYVPSPHPPQIVVPISDNATFHASNVTLDFAVSVSLPNNTLIKVWDAEAMNWTSRYLSPARDRAEITSITYSLDGFWKAQIYNGNSSAWSNTGNGANLTQTVKNGNTTLPYSGTLSQNFSVPLIGLAEGQHTVSVNASCRNVATGVETVGVFPDNSPILLGSSTVYSDEVWSSSEISFTVDASAPNVTLQSPLNGSLLVGSSVALSFLVNEQPSWMAYSLDGETNVTIEGNTSITGVPEGNHTLTVYASDVAGTIGASETTTFTIVQPQTPAPTSSETLEPTVRPLDLPEGDNASQEGTYWAIVVVAALAIIISVIVVAIVAEKRKRQ